MALSPGQQRVANQLYSLAVSRGFTPAHAREIVATSYAESGLNPRATNRSSGAAGLFQLLSSGYRTKAQSLGGVYNPRANALAIFPNYQSYWRTHPNAAPGEAGRDVELSGQGASFYSNPLSLLGSLGGTGAPAGPPTPAGPPSRLPGAPTAAPASDPARAAILNALIAGRPINFLNLPSPWPAGPPTAGPTPARPGVPPTTPTGGAPATGGPASPLGRHIVQFAAAQIGQPYVWGGESRKEGGFDCSGLVDYALRTAGVNLPGRLTTYTALKLGRSVKGQQPQPGDMIIVNGGKHMVLYAGNGRVIAAPHTGAQVQYQPFSRFTGSIVDIRRV